MKKILKCRVCSNKNLKVVLNLGNQYLTGVFPPRKNYKISKGPLKLVKCYNKQKIKKEKSCGLLQLSHDYDLKEMYGNNYGYRSGLNPAMITHLNKKIKNLLKKIKLKKGDLIIDIGSNDGTTLKAYPKKNFKLVGIDPTGQKFKNFYPAYIELIADFFSAKKFKKKFGNKKAKIITSFSMFYDLDEPMNFMKDISSILSDEGIWVFEQSYMPTMLDNNSYDTICHEHKEYYALEQIKWMTDRADLKIIDIEFNKVNGGSFSVAVAKISSHYKVSKKINTVLKNEYNQRLNNLNVYYNFANRIKKHKLKMNAFLDKQKKNGRIVGALGASTKGNVILQYCKIKKDKIHFIGEVNKEKFGFFSPGTYIPIIPEKIAINNKPDYLIVLPWHFKDFFIKQKKFKNTKLVFPLPDFKII